MRRFIVVVGLALGCVMPGSVELGQKCTDQKQCKAPSDTCMVFGVKQLCSMQCTKENRCPDDYKCVRLDTKTQQDGETKASGIAGYCLPAGDVPPRAATVY